MLLSELRKIALNAMLKLGLEHLEQKQGVIAFMNNVQEKSLSYANVIAVMTGIRDDRLAEEIMYDFHFLLTDMRKNAPATRLLDGILHKRGISSIWNLWNQGYRDPMTLQNLLAEHESVEGVIKALDLN